MIGEGDSISHVLSLMVLNEFLFSKTVIEHICNILIKFKVQTLYMAVQLLYWKNNDVSSCLF
jgi:hypothetical protein